MPVASAQISDDVSRAILEQKQAARNNPSMPGTPPAPMVATPPAVATPAITIPPIQTTTVIPPAAVAAPAPASPAAAPFDETAWLKEKFGDKYSSFDDLNAALNRPPEVRFEPPTFPNETSKVVYEALISGKELEVLPHLQNRKLAADIPNMPAEDKVRLHLKAEYGLTDAQVEREFNRLYVPQSEGVDPLDLEIEQKKAAVRLNNDATVAQQYFAKKSEEIKMPFTTPPAPTAPKITPEQEQVMQFGQQFTTDKISSFPFEFNEPLKGISIKGTKTLPTEPIEQLKTKISKAPEHFLAGFLMRYYTLDEKVNVDALARDTYYLDNPSATAADIAKDTLEQTFLQRLKQEKAPGATSTGTAFMVPEDAERANAYKGMRIPIARPQAVTVPQG